MVHHSIDYTRLYQSKYRVYYIIHKNTTSTDSIVKKEKIYGVGRRDFDLHICVVLCAVRCLYYKSGIGSDRIRV